MEDNKKVPKGVEKLVEMIAKLEPQEFIGICKILNIPIYTVEKKNEQVPAAESTLEKTELNPESTETSDGRESKLENQQRNLDVVIRPADELLPEVIHEITYMNRTRRRNLAKLLRAATKGR